MFSQNIVLPSKPRVVKEEGHRGIYEIDALYPGYGHTLGNSLRRIILSSLPGIAITSLSIAGVKHEFSTIEGVKEDVISIILNLKKICFSHEFEEAQRLSLKVTGPKVVTAKDLELKGGVEILNPEIYLFEITGKVEVGLEINLEKGIGYVSKEQVEKEKTPIGSISLDAPFSPIKRVSYEVENMRVGDRTDYNRLRIIIETNGSITPKEALEYSISTMIKQLQALVGFKETPTLNTNLLSDDMPATTVTEVPHSKIKIEELGFSTRTEDALLAGGVKTLAGLLKKSEENLKEIGGLGEKAVEEIRESLKNKGLSLKI